MSACPIRDRRPPTGSRTTPSSSTIPAIIWNTLLVTFAATAMALLFGFATAWILTRTNVPFRRTLDQLMTVPYYVTPLLGALAWSFLGSPESGFVNQVWRKLGGTEALIDMTSPFGIAWVMALFEGSVAYVMISAVMQSMDPALEEASQVIGASRRRTMWRITLPLVAPGVLGAAIFVFAEMLGSFAVPLVLGTPARFYVITTAIYHFISQYPPRIPLAAAMGVSLFAVMFAMLWFYRWLTSRTSFVTVTGKAFRPRAMDMGALRWWLFGVVAFYVFLSAILPVATLAYAASQKIAVAFPAAANFTLEHFRQAFSINAVRIAMWNSLILGAVTATLGVAITGMLALIILRSKVPGRGALEYLAMFPAGGAAPRLRVRDDVGMARLPAADLRHVLDPADRLPDGVHAARRSHDLRRHPAARQEPRRVRPGLRRVLGLPPAHDHGAAAPAGAARRLAAHLRRERARARRVDPADGTGQQGDDTRDRRGLVLDELGTDRRHGADPDGRDRLDHADFRVAHAPAGAPRSVRAMTSTSAPAIAVENLSIRYGSVTAVETISFTVDAGRQLTLLGPSGCGKTSTLRAVAGLEKPTSGTIRIGGRTVFDGSNGLNVPAEQRGMSMVFQSYAIWPHMTVFDNVAYGLRVRNESGAALKEKVRHALELVKMGPYAERNASALSGGQQQRVALARAIAFSPSVILFDEPLSNLDAKLRSEMRIELRELQRRLGVTSLYVTHDLEEALAMSDRIVVMRTGVVEQSGTPAEIYDYPRTEFVADFIGSANLVSGEVVSSDDRGGTVVIRTAGGNVVHGVTHGRPVGAARHALHSHRPLQAGRGVRPRARSTCGRRGSFVRFSSAT